jgi:hypothetical protein
MIKLPNHITSFTNVTRQHYSPAHVNQRVLENSIFSDRNSINKYFYESSNENLAFDGTVIDWITYNATNITGDQVAANKDAIIQFAADKVRADDPLFDITEFDMLMLYVLAPQLSNNGSLHEQFNSITNKTVNDTEGSYSFGGVNVFVNSPIFKQRSSSIDREEDSRLLPNFQWINSVFKTLSKTVNGVRQQYTNRSDLLRCTNINNTATFSLD